MESYDQLTKNLTRHFILRWKVSCTQLARLRNSPVLLEVDFFRQRLRLAPGALPSSPGKPARAAHSQTSSVTQHCYPLDHVVTIHRSDAQSLQIRTVGQGNALVGQTYSLGFSNAEQCDEFHRLLRGNIIVDGPRVVDKFLNSRPSPEGYISLDNLADHHWKDLLQASLEPHLTQSISFFSLFSYLISCKEQLERTAPPQKMFGVRLWPKETVLLCCPLTWRVHPRLRILTRGALFITTARLLFCTYRHLTQVLSEADYDRFLERGSGEPSTDSHTDSPHLVSPFLAQTLSDRGSHDREKISVSFLAIDDVQVVRSQQLRLDLSDRRCLVFGFDRLSLPSLAKSISRMVNQYRQDVRRLFTFQSFDHQLEASGLVSGWQLYDAAADYSRLGLSSGDWRLMRSSSPICFSYPELVPVPASFSDEKVRASALCRRHSRFPVTVFRFAATQATLSRSSSPVRPPPNAHNSLHMETDEELLGILRVLNPNWPTRPLFIAAMGSSNERDMGVVSPSTTFRYFLQRSSNPSELQKSWQQFAQLVAHCSDSQNCSRDPPVVADAGSFDTIFAANVPEPPAALSTRALAEQLKRDTNWHERLGQSRWLKNVRLLLYHARLVVEIMTARRSSVLLHDTDGWDRAAQVSSLAQLMLDPHYRSVRGFCELVEKEWLTLGHPFALRSGWAHSHTAATSSDHDHSLETALQQRSPVFQLWMDCVWQLTEQFPTEFEFSATLLIFILEHLYTGRYGTFLLNSDRQRTAAQVPSRTLSLWTTVLSAIELDPRHPFLNPIYGLEVSAKNPCLPTDLDEEKQVGRGPNSASSPEDSLESGGEAEKESDELKLSADQVDKLIVNWWTNRLRLLYDRYDNDRIPDCPREIQCVVEENRRSLPPSSSPSKAPQPASHILNEHMPTVIDRLLAHYGVSQAQVNALWEIGGALDPPELLAASSSNSAYTALSGSQVFSDTLSRRHIQDEGSSGGSSIDAAASNATQPLADDEISKVSLVHSSEWNEIESFPGVLRPTVRQHAVLFWREFYLRWDAHPDEGQPQLHGSRHPLLAGIMEKSGSRMEGSENELRKAQNALEVAQTNLSALDIEVSKLTSEKRELIANLAEETHQRQAVETSKSDLAAMHDDSTKQMSQVSSQLQSLTATHQADLIRLQKLQEQIATTQNESDDLRRVRSEFDHQLRQHESLKEDHEEKVVALKSAESELVDLGKALEAARESESIQSQLLSESQSALESLRSSDALKAQQITELVSQLESQPSGESGPSNAGGVENDATRLKQLESQLSDALSLVESLEKTRSDLHTELEELRSSLGDSQEAQKTLEDAQDDLCRVRKEYDEALAQREELLALVKTRDAAQAKLQERVAELERLESGPRASNAETISSLESRCQELLALVEDFNQKFVVLTAQNTSLQSSIDSLTVDLEAERASSAQHRSAMSKLQTEVASLEKSKEECEASLAELETQVGESEGNLWNTRGLLDQAREAHAATSKTLEDLKVQLREKEAQVTKTEARAQEMARELEIATAELRVLREVAVERFESKLSQKESQIQASEQDSRPQAQGLEEKMAEQAHTLAFLQGQALETKEQLRLLEDVKQRLGQDSQTQTEQISTLRSVLAEKDTANRALEAQISELKLTSQGQVLQISDLERSLGSSRQSSEEKQLELTALFEEKSELSQKLHQQETTIARLEEKGQTHSQQIARMEGLLQSQSEKHAQREKTLQTLSHQWNHDKLALQQSSAKLEADLEQLREAHGIQKTALEIAQSQAKEMECSHQNQASRIQELMEANAALHAELGQLRRKASEDEQKRRHEEEVRLFEAEKLPSDQLKWTVSIPSWGHRQEEDKSIVFFQIKVREYYTRRKYLFWTVQKRYSEFDKLHKVCKQTLRHLPPLPPKSRIGKAKRSKEFLNQRQKSLETMLQALLKEPELLGTSSPVSPSRSRSASVVGRCASAPLVKFLEIGAPGREVQEGNDS